MTSSKANVEGILLFEQPFLRVPFENYRKVFRTHQKHVERELGALQTGSKEIASKVKAGTLSKEDASRSLEVLIGRVNTLKSKLDDLHTYNGKPTLDVIHERIEHLQKMENSLMSDGPDYSRWLDDRLDRWLVDWMLRNGKEKTAKALAKQKEIETLVDIDLFADMKRIETGLLNHSCVEALSWCSDNKSALKKAKNPLEFELRFQEYVELCRQRKTDEAIVYLRKHLASWKETHSPQIFTASALIAFPETTSSPGYRRLYDQSRWATLVESFRQSIYALNSLPSQPLLHLAMYGGLAALKLPACFDSGMKNVDCPVCDSETFGVLGEEVPLSQHLHSTIVCRITGKIMDHDNMPMAFPNGYVYSREALEDMAARHNGKVTCPRSQCSCDFSELRKVFIS